MNGQKLQLADIKTAYFIGIGGIGMSALARYMNYHDVQVHGYDSTKTALTESLSDEGMTIHYEEAVDQLPKGIDLVVYTPAVPSTHKELVHLREQGIPVMKRAEVLGIISRNSRTIGVAGTHGKTTTSTILTHILRTGDIDCTAFLGGISGNLNSNFIAGRGEWVVVEADEFDRSFLQLDPELAIILSMDADHLDIYGDHSAIKDSFNAYAERVKPDGKVFLRHDLSLENTSTTVETFGVEKGDYRSKNLRVEFGKFVFDYESPIENIAGIMISLPGRHNVENASAAIAVAQQLGVKAKDIKFALASFKGIKRRFETIIENSEIVYIDDYAHHPEELKAAISTAKTLYPEKKITGIFQPHLFSRTKDFQDGFAAALDELDEPILLDIYPAREEPMPGVTSKIILDKMNNPNKQLMTKAEVKEAFSREDRIRNTQVLLTLGAGDIGRLVPVLKERIDEVTD